MIKSLKIIISEWRFSFYKLLDKIGLRPIRGLFYIGGADSLPPPLTPEEEVEILSRYTGEEPEIKQKLIEHNLRLVVYIARKFENTGIGIEDLISIGTIGLIKSVNTYRIDKKHQAGYLCFPMYRK